MLEKLLPTKPTEFGKVIVPLLLSIITSSVVAQTIDERIATNDPDKYKFPVNVPADSSSLRFARIFDRSKLAVSFYSLYAVKIQPQTGTAKHSHPNMDELYVLLDGEAEFTVNGHTSLLKAPVIVPNKKGDSLSIYNPADSPLRLLSFIVSESKGKRDTIVPAKKHIAARLDDTPAFTYRQLDRKDFKTAEHPWKANGVLFGRLLSPGVFDANLSHVDHVIIPAGTSAGPRRLNDMQEVYYVIKGSGMVAINADSVAIGADKAITGLTGERITLINKGNEDLEVLVVGIAATKEKVFFSPYILALCLSFLVSLTVYIRPFPGEIYLKLFPPFLLLTIGIEYWGHYLSVRGVNNMMLYNFFTLFEFLYYLIIISLIVQGNRIRKGIMITMVVYSLIAIINILFIQDKRMFHSMGYALGCLIVVAFCVSFFLELFRAPKSIKLAHNPAFWICSGLLFFYCCGFPLYGLANYWGDISSLVLNYFSQIVMIMNVFLYSLFTIAFICTRTRRYSLSPS
jgi:mannose-6-phosphate isomerase-like protein (cupin superfamily)